jgi:hypothetical protein
MIMWRTFSLMVGSFLGLLGGVGLSMILSTAFEYVGMMNWANENVWVFLLPVVIGITLGARASGPMFRRQKDREKLRAHIRAENGRLPWRVTGWDMRFSGEPTLTAQQVTKARTLLRLTVRELGERAGITGGMAANAGSSGAKKRSEEVVARVRAVFEAAGIEFYVNDQGEPDARVRER